MDERIGKVLEMTVLNLRKMTENDGNCQIEIVTANAEHDRSSSYGFFDGF